MQFRGRVSSKKTNDLGGFVLHQLSIHSPEDASTLPRVDMSLGRTPNPSAQLIVGPHDYGLFEVGDEVLVTVAKDVKQE